MIKTSNECVVKFGMFNEYTVCKGRAYDENVSAVQQ